ncbi:MAG: hypothetical protein ACRD1Z_14365 [Vicinamibacteria bacterium]
MRRRILVTQTEAAPPVPADVVTDRAVHATELVSNELRVWVQ